ncbi:hypothetical protein LAWI1_G004450 [Lachnellula willkommii]|uniref:NB-ARC domain-containing protein n=1 Tax=Lachnellula willkommii TaxID=215461 RepID=A0A559MEV9_9HELO|nr:hypothetical protein LAWI1_G004450 [Lachnellula willkommii]
MVRSTASIEPTASIQSEEQNENTPVFIKPSGFRPNSLFVGREAQLAEMHKMLTDKKRRAQGTSAILLQSLPGGGKSHLAREYVYEHREDFPGGIFWLRAKSPAELANGFWDIARKAVLQHSVDKEDLAALRDPQQFIKIVRKWLNRRENWLLVLDGIHFTDDADALRKFIPDSKNTSLIYTSTEKSASGDHHFMNPQVIKLPNLSAREAQRLLLLEIDKREPFLKEDSKYAMELVQAMGFLPVVIHAVAQRLKATEEPLSKFAKSYSNEPRLRGLGTYMAVVDQLKAHGSFEALNLIHVLCFFSQHIPVEMIALGLRALDVDVKATDPATGHSLNTTFKHLNTFALIDRDHDHDHEETLQSSQSSKNTGDILADNLDVIQIHSVVQGFFVDTLNAAGTLPIWLDRAARVFCCSYDHATIRITKKTHAGLVEDYRLYEIHGSRLREHLVRHSKKWPELGEAHQTLDQYLEAIQSEIERRTPESSQTIAGGRPDAFQTSIFDRTSSSSDAGPETPSDRLTSHVSTFGFEPEKSLLESPLSATRDNEYTRLVEIREGHGAPHNHLQLPATEDDGYDSDREGSTAMTLQPSQQTLHPPETPISSDGAWETVPSRRWKRPRGLDLHRTISRLEKSKYSDRAGSFRAMSAIDPRLSTENAHGYVQKPSSRAQSRGRMSGHSHAEVALTNITASSPPPARGGGKIVGRPSSGTREKSHFVAGSASYAAAVASSTKDAIPSFEEIIRQTTEPSRKPATSVSTLDSGSGGSALESLQKFPVEALRHPAEPRVLTLMPPYPPTPGTDPDVTYEQPFPDKALYDNRSYSQENLHLGPDPFSTNIYPRMPGTIPVETRDFSSPPLKRSLPHDYSTWHSQTYSDSMSRSMHLPPHPQTQTSNQNPPYLSLSSPNIRRPHSNSSPRPSTYYPGHPELSFSSPPNQHDGGYTSQPMSRDPSGQSVGSAERGRGRRRSSIAETEPLPQLPTFSPVILPTSYQVYERIQERKLLDEMMVADRGRKTAGPVRKSPRLGNARAALIEKLDDSAEK